MRLIEADKVTLATSLLEADAEIWWDSVQIRYPAQPSWEEFEREFCKQYYTQYHCNLMVVEFYQLTQGTRSVVEYAAVLRKLSQFLSESERTESLMGHRFEEGLASEIRVIMGTHEPQGFRSLVTAAEKAELLAKEQRMMSALEQSQSVWDRGCSSRIRFRQESEIFSGGSSQAEQQPL